VKISLFIIFILIFLWPNHPLIADASIASLIREGDLYLDKWQVSEAYNLSDKAFESAKTTYEKGTASYLKSRVEFYKGNYIEAVRSGERAKALLPNEKEISDFLEYISMVAITGEEFKEVKTTHFIIRYLHTKDSILPGYAEKALEKAYYEIGKDLGIYPSEPVIVEIYPNPESFATSSTLSQKEIETTRVVGVCKFNRIMIISPRLLPQGYSWLDSLVHEYTHYLIFRKSENKAPVWLHEGIAKFKENRWKSKNKRFINPFYETLIARALKENKLVPIKEMHPSFGKLSSAYEAQLAFAQVGTIIDFLVNRWGNNSLSDLLDNLRIKDNYEIAIRNVTGMNFTDFYNSWIRNLKTRNLQERIPRLRVNELRFEKDGQKSKEQANDLNDLDDTRAREYTRIGDMLKSRGRLKAAFYEYDKASKLDPVSPIVMNRLASTQSGLGEYGKAEHFLSQSIEFHPEFVDTYINLGRIYIQNGNFNKAEEAYSTANSINPFDPEIHLALITLYEKMGLPDLVKTEKNVLNTILNQDISNKP
jgi:tetratricopeptide (TPR) repeat protein